MIIIEVYDGEKLIQESNVRYSYEINYPCSIYYDGVDHEVKSIEKQEKPWGILIKLRIK